MVYKFEKLVLSYLLFYEFRYFMSVFVYLLYVLLLDVVTILELVTEWVRILILGNALYIQWSYIFTANKINSSILERKKEI